MYRYVEIKIAPAANMYRKAIYVFTCDCPQNLIQIIRDLSCLEGRYYISIIDDSSDEELIKENLQIARMCKFSTYLGRNEFRNFYETFCPSGDPQLGDKSWNLGIARNFALDHSRLKQYEKILFIDEDISNVNEKVVANGFAMLNEDNFVSCQLSGDIDDSILGHISKQLGIIDENSRMLSGGFLFLMPKSLSHRFYNVYNEDWIMQFLEKEKEQVILQSFVKHNSVIKKQWNLEQVVFQEIGEIIVEGLIKKENALELDRFFWNEIIRERVEYVEEIRQQSLMLNNENYYHICNNLLIWLGQQDASSILKHVNINYEKIKNKV